MLNVSKAKNLKKQATTIKSKAVTLYTNANELAQKVTSNKELRELGETLRDAVGADQNSGLQKALKLLSTASDDSDMVEKALAVVNKYNEVAAAYDKVKAQETQYTNALKAGDGGDESDKYTQVETAFKALETAYKLGQCNNILPKLT